MPDPNRFVALADPDALHIGANDPRCAIAGRLTILAGVVLAMVTCLQRVTIREPAEDMDWQQPGRRPSQLFAQPMTGGQQRLQSMMNFAPPAFRGLLPKPMGITKKVTVWPIKALGSDGAVRSITLNPAAKPNIRKAGPAEVSSEQAETLRALMNEKHMVFDSSVDRALEALSEQQEEEEGQQLKLQRTADESEFEVALRKRTDEIRRNERQRIVTELLYLKACNKFKRLLVPMVPSLKAGGDALFGTIDPKSLTSDVHTEDATKLVMQRLFDTFGPKILAAPDANDAKEVVKIALIEVARSYSEFSVIGYSLRNANRRFQLDKMMESVGVQGEQDRAADTFAEDGRITKSLKQYISSLEPDELERMSIVNSVEARMALELQVAGLFGDLSILTDKYQIALSKVKSEADHHNKLGQAIENGEVESIRLTTGDLARLMLEAAAFGALLNDAEKQINSIYELTPLHQGSH
jgi:hypothetical protein